jgi:hypothetical protein
MPGSVMGVVYLVTAMLAVLVMTMILAVYTPVFLWLLPGAASSRVLFLLQSSGRSCGRS